MDAVVVSIGMELKWSPDVLGELFIDDMDHWGALYWYNEIRRRAEEYQQEQQKAQKKR